MYEMIFKRKSFHIFRNTGMISEDELEDLKEFIDHVVPLDPTIQTLIKIVEENKTTCKRGAQYCIEFYSENKGNYLRNIGYIGEQIDLYCTSQNIGTLWFGIGKPDQKEEDGLRYIIMIAIAKMDASSFRKDMFKSKRKSLEEIWIGEPLPLSNVVRYAPSACNTQPWIVEKDENELTVYRYKKPGKRGIMPVDRVRYYNRIDVGIFLYILELCLDHDGYNYQSEQYFEDADDSVEKVIVAKYKFVKE